MGKWLLIASGIIVIAAIIAVVIGQARESAKADELGEQLLQSAFRPVTGTVAFASLADLPSPVARYFRHVLTDGQALIKTARMRQAGMLRTHTTTDSWFSFTARHLVVPPATGFVWNAKVAMPLATPMHVLDSYSAGVGGRLRGWGTSAGRGSVAPVPGRGGLVSDCPDETLHLVWKGDLINAWYDLGL